MMLLLNFYVATATVAIDDDDIDNVYRMLLLKFFVAAAVAAADAPAAGG